jgi:hypothetical protein
VLVPRRHSVPQPVQRHLIIGAASGGHRPITATSHLTAATAPCRALGRTEIAVTMRPLESLRRTALISCSPLGLSPRRLSGCAAGSRHLGHQSPVLPSDRRSQSLV